MRSTHAGHDRSIRRDAAERASASRPLSTTERRWLLDQLARQGKSNGGAAAEPAAIPGGTSDMITSNPGTHGTQAAPEETPEIRAEPTPAPEPSAATVAAARPTLAALATARATNAAAAAASQVARSAHRAAPRTVATPYRAVFACAMQAQGAPEEA